MDRTKAIIEGLFYRPINRLNNSWGHIFKLFFDYFFEETCSNVSSLRGLVYSGLFFDFSKETLVTSPRRIFATSFQPR